MPELIKQWNEISTLNADLEAAGFDLSQRYTQEEIIDDNHRMFIFKQTLNGPKPLTPEDLSIQSEKATAEADADASVIDKPKKGKKNG